MEMTGEQRIEAPRAKVWAALNDPDVLKRCIPGCQSLEKDAEDRLRAVVAIKIGPISARFNGEVTLSDLDPPNGYRISGEGQGGAAGVAKGGASVRLRDDGDATVLSYEASAQVGGKIAQLGGAIIDATAKQMAGAFFKRLAEIVTAPAAEAQPAPAAAPRPAAAPAPSAVASPAAPVAATRPPAAPARSGPHWASLAILAAGLVGFLIGRGGDWRGDTAWSGLAIGLVVVLVAAAAHEFGRRAAGSVSAPVIVLDAATLARLAQAQPESDKS